jgi:hypothetical protein
MDVRQVRPTDAPLVLSLAIDESAHLVKGRDWPKANSLKRTLVRTTLPLALPGRSWIARDGSSVALLEAQPRQYVIGWDITRLAVRGDALTVLPPVVDAVTSCLQSRGVPRLFARCREEARETLKALGFQPLACEFVLLGPKGRPAADVPLPDDSRYRLPDDSRYRMPADEWPLHQLEHDCTPPLVRQFEGLTSLTWSRKDRNVSEIVVERDGRIAAWIGWGARVGPGQLQLGMLIHPRYKDLAPVLLHHALRRMPPEHRFIARVRDYQIEAFRALLDAGFEIAAEENLMLKHATVEPVRAAKRRMRVASVPSIQALPIRLSPPARGLRPATTPTPVHEDD